MFKKIWICDIKKQHQWDVSEEYARKMIFCRADCELCGRHIDATKLVWILDGLRERNSSSRVRSIYENLAKGFKPTEGEQ